MKTHWSGDLRGRLRLSPSHQGLPFWSTQKPPRPPLWVLLTPGRPPAHVQSVFGRDGTRTWSGASSEVKDTAVHSIHSGTSAQAKARGGQLGLSKGKNKKTKHSGAGGQVLSHQRHQDGMALKGQPCSKCQTVRGSTGLLKHVRTR